MIKPSDPSIPHYYGVSWHKSKRKWRAAFRYRDRDLWLGTYDDPSLAAWVVDFARYLCFGMNPALWHFKVGKPNFSPSLRHDFPRALIISKLVSANTLAPEELSRRLADFDKSCQI